MIWRAAARPKPTWEDCMSKRLLRRHLLALTAALVGSVAAGLEAPAQTPGRTITIVVPFTAGTGPDILARTIGEELSQRWGQPVIVDNKPGASGNIGAQLASRAAPDGHTVMMTTNPFTANPSLFRTVPYDPIKSFAPIIFVGTGALALALHPSVPATTTQAFIDYLKARPGQVNYGSPGIGTPHHLAMELFKLTTKTDLKHVPYRGSAGATQDLLGGHVSAGFQAVHVIMPMAQENQVRLLATASKERVPVAPDLPSLHEQGLTGFEVDLWYAIVAPANTPPAIVTRYNTTINEILKTPAVVEKLAKQGLAVAGGTPERAAQFLAADLVKWQQVVKEAGITAD
jgi:tripartite-type tricarboxylate transporter receptor subunit TctC